jgi:predicted nucleic acid-binding protein
MVSGLGATAVLRIQLIRIRSHVALTNLDALGAVLDYLPLSMTAMRLAAELWARVRSAGQTEAATRGLDGDVILAAQTLSFNTPAIVATANPGHLTRFVTALPWSSITP